MHASRNFPSLAFATIGRRRNIIGFFALSFGITLGCSVGFAPDLLATGGFEPELEPGGWEEWGGASLTGADQGFEDGADADLAEFGGDLQLSEGTGSGQTTTTTATTAWDESSSSDSSGSDTGTDDGDTGTSGTGASTTESSSDASDTGDDLLELPAIDCALEKNLSSSWGPETYPDAIYFENAADHKRRLYWLDPNKNRKPYATLNADDIRRQKTRGTDVWVVTDTSGRCVSIYRGIEGESRAVIRTVRSEL